MRLDVFTAVNKNTAAILFKRNKLRPSWPNTLNAGLLKDAYNNM